MRRIVDLILLVLVLGGTAYGVYAHPEIVQSVRQVFDKPCTGPVTYSLGTVDPRFGITREKVITDLAEAEAVWETPTKKDLFAYQPTGGAVTINFIYDERQSATDQLKTAGIAISKNQASYDNLKALYKNLSTKVAQEKAAYASQAESYKRAQDAYNTEVDMWNSKGGAPKSEYEKLQAEKDSLLQQFDSLKAMEQTLNADIGTVNALATTLNQLIVQLNLNVAQYNQVGAAAGEFEEGLYHQAGSVRTIDVYEYTDHLHLVRVLAHELGHALGLDHVADASAIMYKINSGTTLTATAADLAELARVCRTN